MKIKAELNQIEQKLAQGTLSSDQVDELHDRVGGLIEAASACGEGVLAYRARDLHWRIIGMRQEVWGHIRAGRFSYLTNAKDAMLAHSALLTARTQAHQSFVV